MQRLIKLAVVACLMLGSPVGPVFAHETNGDSFPHTHTGEQRTVRGSVYKPTIWIDPDGCEHWVMDDGWEGYMTPKLDRNGIPTCHGSRSNGGRAFVGGSCGGNMASDALFATASYRLNAQAQNAIRQFFATHRASSYIIVGHTDSRGSDAYNMRLSRNRANAVAQVAYSLGASIADIRGAGERRPIASNRTRDGMARNRRVEILCVN